MNTEFIANIPKYTRKRNLVHFQKWRIVSNFLEKTDNFDGMIG